MTNRLVYFGLVSVAGLVVAVDFVSFALLVSSPQPIANVIIKQAIATIESSFFTVNPSFSEGVETNIPGNFHLIPGKHTNIKIIEQNLQTALRQILGIPSSAARVYFKNLSVELRRTA